MTSCATGGPSSKHGVWFEDLLTTRDAAARAGLAVTMLHAHIGSGAQFQELHDNLTRLAAEFVAALKHFPDLTAVSLGGGIPHNYKDHGAQVPIEPLHELFDTCHRRLCTAAKRELRLEIEPGRYYVAPGCTLVARVHDVKQTRSNEKGSGATFAMVDAGFVDLIRPAMYGSYHAIDIVGRDDEDPNVPREPIVVAGPLCESGDIFTRDDRELLAPRFSRVRNRATCSRCAMPARRIRHVEQLQLDRPRPQLCSRKTARSELISRREAIDDLLTAERRASVFNLDSRQFWKSCSPPRGW